MPDALPIVCGGETSIDGDIDGDGAPDVQLVGQASFPAGLILFSSNNRVNGIEARDFTAGIGVDHVSAFTPEPRPRATPSPTTSSKAGSPASSSRRGNNNVSTQGGEVRDTLVAGNTTTGCGSYGVIVYTTDAPGTWSPARA